MTTYFLTPLQWLTVLTDSIWIPFHPRILLYQRPQGSWIHGTSVSLCRKVNVLSIHTRSNHEYALSKPTAMPNSADWLHLDTFTPMGDALPRSHVPEGFSTPGKTLLPWRQVNDLAILLNKTMNTHFLSPLQWHTVPTGSNQIPVHLWNMVYQGHKALQHLENQYYHKHQSMFWPFPIDQTMTKHILSTL